MGELGIADCLAAGSRTAEALALETQCQTEALYRFLRAVASVGMLREVEPRRFALTPLSDLLRSDHPHSLRSVARLGGHPLHWRAWGHLLDSVRTGQPAFDAANGKSFFTALDEDGPLSAIFQGVMDRLSTLNLTIVRAVDLGSFERIVDVGGGTGELARQIASVYPHANVVLLDREPVIAMAPAAPRVEPVAGDFLESVPRGGDAYFLKFVLHNWDDQRAAQILRNCRDAMSLDGRVFVIEVVIPGDATPSMAKRHDINMLVLTGGRERTLDDYCTLFSGAGLELVRTTLTESGISVLVGRIT
jgi:O-methyltransferase domain